ncbi:ArsR/SmtB family transcription factor [Metabacillus sp. 84]|uniref:ArsR/SmtB family transcription factor n=1 Tax=Metabacillus sp. 84 TaxID=3404705 RepID=UPI003CF4E614
MAEIRSLSLEMMKILSDPRRLRILNAASERPMTVKQLASLLGEQPSRLYYHVKKLEEAELLEMTETKQLGNLVEKYYKTINSENIIYRGDLQAQASEPELSLALKHQLLSPALQLYEKSLAKIREEKRNGRELTEMPYHVNFSSSSRRMTAKQWRETTAGLISALGVKRESEEPIHQPFKSDEEAEKSGTYQYVLISYRIEDAEELGFIEEKED